MCEGERQCRSRFHSQSGSISSGRPQSRPPRGKLPTVCTSRDDCPCWGGGIAHALSYSPPHTAPHSFAYTHVHACVRAYSLQLHKHTHARTRLQRYKSQGLRCMYLQHAHNSKHTVRAHRRAHTHRCTHLKSPIFGGTVPLRPFALTLKVQNALPRP